MSYVLGSRRVIDTDVTPVIPHGFTLLEHRSNGKLNITKANIALGWYRDQFEKGVAVSEVRSYMATSTVALNATVLDNILMRPELIPYGFNKVLSKGYELLFWGSVFEYRGNEYVRTMVVKGGKRSSWAKRISHGLLEWRQPAVVLNDPTQGKEFAFPGEVYHV
jgi:hypothetical protein